MRKLFTILPCILFAAITFSQNVPKNYYEPYKTIIEKQTLSYGYALYNFTPVVYSRMTIDTNTQKYGEDFKYREKILSGWSNRSIELYQFWAFKKTKGFEFAFSNSSKIFNLYNSLAIAGDIPNYRFQKKETSFEFGWQGSKTIQGPLFGIDVSINRTSIALIDINNNPINKQNLIFSPYLGIKLKMAGAFVNKVKARFGFQEYVYFKTCKNGNFYDNNGIVTSTLNPKRLINVGGGLRFYRMSKSIRTIGACYTYFDGRADWQYITNDGASTSRAYLTIPLFIGIGLSW